MVKNIDFIIYYEHVAREWNSVNRLKLELNKLGLVGVIFPKHFYKYISIALYRPKIVILPYLYSAKNDQHLMFEKIYGDIPVINLHSEQLHDETTKHFQLPHDEYSASSYHVAWGEKFAQALIDYGVNKNLIYKTGSIRNDDSQDLLKNSFKKGGKVREKVLIPTAFSKTFVSDIYIEKLTSLDTINKEQYLQKLDVTRSVRDEYFRSFYEIAKAHPNILFSFRPHPYVEIKDYISAFLITNNLDALPSNIEVARNGSIQDEILSCDKVITWYSSTAIDCYLLGKEVIIFEPVKAPDYMKIDFLKFFPSAENPAELTMFLKNGVTGTSKEKIDNYIKHVYGEVDGQSAERLALTTNEILKYYKPQHTSFNLINYLVNLTKCIYIDLPKLFLMRVGLLDRVKSFYKGVCEDNKVNLSCINQSSSRGGVAKFKKLLTPTGFEFVRK